MIAILGAGKMGEALISGLLRSGWAAERLIATERRRERAEELAERYGIRIVENDEAVALADVLAIAVKPQDAVTLMAELSGRTSAFLVSEVRPQVSGDTRGTAQRPPPASGPSPARCAGAN